MTLGPWYVKDDCTSDEHIAHDVLYIVSDQLPSHGIYDVSEFQILTPQHRGPCGTIELNRALQRFWQKRAFNVDVPDTKHVVFHKGDKILFTKNDYTLNVMNGTLAIVEHAKVLIEAKAHMIVRTTDDEMVNVPLDGEHLGNVSLAYAMTIHKSQGAEWPVVIVVMAKSQSFMGSRPLLYTACTRAKRTCIIVGERLAIKRALANVDAGARRTWLSTWDAAQADAAQAEGGGTHGTDNCQPARL